jgi:hypothetical protein
LDSVCMGRSVVRSKVGHAVHFTGLISALEEGTFITEIWTPTDVIPRANIIYYPKLYLLYSIRRYKLASFYYKESLNY